MTKAALPMAKFEPNLKPPIGIVGAATLVVAILEIAKLLVTI